MQQALHLDRQTIQARLQEFSTLWSGRVAEWKQESTLHTESSFAQTYWSGLLRCFGIIPERIDLFEKDAVRASTGNRGSIDLFWSGLMLGEAKSLGKDLDRAQRQALDYLAGGSIAQHEWPKYVLVTDFERLRLTKLGEDGWTSDITIQELPQNMDQFMFLTGVETYTPQEQKQASLEASRLMINLFQAMLGDDIDVPVAEEAGGGHVDDNDNSVELTSMWLTRLLFLLFGDDAGLWEQDLFYRFVLEETSPSTLGPQLVSLFQVLNTPPEKRRRVPGLMAKFPYVNGNLFSDSLAPEFFTIEMREALLDACRFQWARISPAIFGSLFQLVKSKEARRADGEHYTSETNILKVLEPLFLDELREKARRLTTNASSTARQLRQFKDSLAEMTFCDPACGCGNFLVVAYRELRKIETDIIVALREKEGETTGLLDISFDQRLSIDQFHGFEINWWPAKIAETAMFLVDHQANQELAAKVGMAPERLPITMTAHIHHGNALRMDWKELLPARQVTYIFGNPPFIGQYGKSKEQTEDMKLVWGKNYDGYLDYVTAWHAKALDYFSQRAGEFAYVTTNSITQGQPVPALFGPLYKDGWDIKFAHRTFAWDSEAPGKAAVHCVIVGFSRERGPQKLWDYHNAQGEPELQPVRHRINAYLIDGQKVLVKKRTFPLSSELPKVTFGSKPADGGNLIVEQDQYDEVAADPIAAKYLRKFLGARELLHNEPRWCLWMAGIEFNPQDIQKSEILKTRVKAVESMRLASKKEPTRRSAVTPYLFQENHKSDTDYVCIPSVVSETRRYFTVQHLSADVISSNAVFNAVDPDGLLFGLISSSMFITWQKTVGGRLKSDLRFSNTLVWNNFPVPKLSDQDKQAIIAAGKGVLEARALHPERSLADHYNPLAMDPELIKAHDKLDRVVDKAMGARRKLITPEQRLEVLFANYQQLTSN